MERLPGGYQHEAEHAGWDFPNSHCAVCFARIYPDGGQLRHRWYHAHPFQGAKEHACAHCTRGGDDIVHRDRIVHWPDRVVAPEQQ